MEFLQNPFMAYAEIPPFTNPEITGYGDAKTTYWGDFRVCGGDIDAIRDTYKRACEMAKHDRDYGTELAIVLNWLCWAYAETHEDVAREYEKLWRDLDGYIMDNWKGDDLQYYLRATD